MEESCQSQLRSRNLLQKRALLLFTPPSEYDKIQAKLLLVRVQTNSCACFAMRRTRDASGKKMSKPGVSLNSPRSSKCLSLFACSRYKRNLPRIFSFPHSSVTVALCNHDIVFTWNIEKLIDMIKLEQNAIRQKYERTVDIGRLDKHFSTNTKLHKAYWFFIKY